MRRYYNKIAVAVLVVAVAGLYLRVRDFGLIIYDDYAITDFLRHAGGCGLQGVLAAFTDGPACFPYNIPVTTWSYLVNHCLWPDDFGKQHLTNLLLHMANTLLLLYLLYSTTRAFWRSFFVAVLFAIHPMNTGFVAPFSGRTSLLSTFFFLLSIIAYARYEKRRDISSHIASVLLFLAGLGSKPDIIHLPFILVLLNYWPLVRPGMGRPGENNMSDGPSSPDGHVYTHSPVWMFIKGKALFFGVAFAWGGAALYLYNASPKYGDLDPLLLARQLVNAPVSYMAYLWEAIAPFDLYSFNRPRLQSVLPLWQIAGASLVGVLMTVFILMASRRHRYMAVGWLWFLITITPPVLVNVFRSEITANRYLYLPGIGLFIALVWEETAVIERFGRYRRVFLFLFFAWLSVLVALAWRQVGYHRDHATFYSKLHGVIHGYNSRILDQLANYMLSTGRFSEAIDYFSDGLLHNPDNPSAYNSLGVAFENKGDEAKALEAYRKALQLSPDYASAHNNLANLLVDLGRLDEAVFHYRKVLEIDPLQPEAYNNLATALARKGDVEQAIECLKQALAINPEYSTARENLGRLLDIVGHDR